MLRVVLAGGDRRMELVRELLIGQGHQVEWIHDGGSQQWQESMAHSDLFLLPYPYAVRDGYIPGWKSGGEDCIDSLLEKLAFGTPVLAGSGLSEKTVQFAKARGLRLACYQDDPVFLQRNTEISAEAAVEALMRRSERTLDELRIMVLGYGLFGRAIAVRLKALGARVWVVARRQAQRQLAVHDGIPALPIDRLVSVVPDMDAVLNTIPAVVLGREQLAHVSMQTVLLELASPPYGIDLPAAAQLSLQAEVLPGLPAQYAPHSAARALVKTILKRVREGME